MLHILDLAVNAVEAGARTVRIRVVEDPERDRLEIRVADDGPGMTAEFLARALDRLVSTRAGHRRPIGLGFALLRGTAEACGGTFRVISRPGRGTLVEARMRRSHIDRPPVGDCAATVLGLVVANPEVGIRFTRGIGSRGYAFDSRTARRVLGGTEGLGRPEVVGWIRRELEQGERALVGERLPGGDHGSG